MSRSNPNLTNPAAHLYEWNGGNGTISYYDNDKKENITVPFNKTNPFEFLVLDQLNGITGWSDRDNIGIWSTETRSTRDDFTVRAGKRVLYVGPYKNEQGINQVAGFGGKYCKIVYFAMFDVDGSYVINRMKLVGAALNAWIEFTQHRNVESGKVLITGKTEGKKGATTYQTPNFEYVKATDDEDKMAANLDKVLQVFLSQYLAPRAEDEEKYWPSDQIDDDLGKATPEQIADFEQRKRLKETKNSQKEEPFKTGDQTTTTIDDAEDDAAIQTYIDTSQVLEDGSPLPDFPGDV